MDILSNYCAYKKNEVILVFDGYKLKGNAGERFNYHSLRVAYTKENETADMFIERLIFEIGKNYSRSRCNGRRNDPACKHAHRHFAHDGAGA